MCGVGRGRRVTEPNGQWGWLEQAAREAREIIDRLYAEGRSELEEHPVATPGTVDRWPGGGLHAGG